jgi:hypothetical protein
MRVRTGGPELVLFQLWGLSGITGTVPMLELKSSQSGQRVPDTFNSDEAEPQSWNCANSGPPAISETNFEIQAPAHTSFEA